jgi:phosphoglycolate phosphatase-like HAD superfamily hydrolase
MMTSRLLLVDLDRTLIDLQSYTDYAAALADVEQLIGAWSDADVPDTDWDRPTQACMAVLHSKLGDPRWYEVSAAIAGHERAAIPRSSIMPTVQDALDRLTSVPVAVVTLLPADVATEVLQAHGIGVGTGRVVDLVVGRDASIRPKPWPDGLLVACDRLGGAAVDATMIGDSSWDEEAARRAGIPFIGVPSSPTGFPAEVAVAAAFAEAVDRAVGE